MSASTRLRTALALACVLTASTAFKLALILAPPADLYRVGKQAVGYSWIGEEAHRGTTTLDLLQGTVLPLLDYQYAPFFGGALVVSCVALPFFAWLGPSVSALKLSGLLFNGVATLFLFLALDRIAGRRAAWIGGLLFALAPPGYGILAITAFGSHVEANAFAAAALFCVTVLAGGGGSRAAALGLGFTAGFGLYFSYILGLSLAAVGLAWLLGARLRGLRAGWPWIGAGFLLGFAPWLAFNAPRGFPGLSIYGGSLRGPALEEAPGAFERVRSLLVDGYPGSFFFDDLGPLSGRVQGLTSAFVFGLLVLFALGLTLRRTRHAREDSGARQEPERPGVGAAAPLTPARVPGLGWAFALQPALFVLSYACTSFEVGDEPHAVVSFRYVYAIFPFVAGAAGLALAALAARGGGARWLAAALAFGLATPAAVGSARLVDGERWLADFETEGYSYPAFGRFLVMTFADRPEVLLGAVERIYEVRSAEEQHEILFGMSMQLRQLLLAKRGLRPRMQRIRELCPPLLPRLHAAVRAEHQAYFEPVGPGTRVFRPDQREEFWRAQGVGD